MENKKFNVYDIKKYTNKKGEEKSKWFHIGEVVLYEKEGKVGCIVELAGYNNLFAKEKTYQDNVGKEKKSKVSNNLELKETPFDDIDFGS